MGTPTLPASGSDSTRSLTGHPLATLLRLRNKALPLHPSTAEWRRTPFTSDANPKKSIQEYWTLSTSLTPVAPTETSSPSSTPLKERRLSPSTSSQLSLSKSMTSSPVSTLESTAELSPRTSQSMTVTTSDLSPSRSRPAARPSKHPELRKSQLVEASL